MSELEEKLGAVLSNPQLMQQIMSMAQSLGGSQPSSEDTQKPQVQSPPQTQPPQQIPGIDTKLLKSISAITSGSHVDQNQQALLHALAPYLSSDRVGKLERAMRAAKMAGAASAFLNNGGAQLLNGISGR